MIIKHTNIFSINEFEFSEFGHLGFVYQRTHPLRMGFPLMLNTRIISADEKKLWQCFCVRLLFLLLLCYQRNIRMPISENDSLFSTHQ